MKSRASNTLMRPWKEERAGEEEKRLGKNIDEEYGGLQSHSVFASEVPRFVDQQHSVESAEFARLTGRATLQAGRPKTPPDGGPRGRARSRLSKRTPSQRPTSSFASTSTRGMYDYWPTTLKLKGWRNAPRALWSSPGAVDAALHVIE